MINHPHEISSNMQLKASFRVLDQIRNFRLLTTFSERNLRNIMGLQEFLAEMSFHVKRITILYQMEPQSTIYLRSGAHPSTTHCQNRDFDHRSTRMCANQTLQFWVRLIEKNLLRTWWLLSFYSEQSELTCYYSKW